MGSLMKPETAHEYYARWHSSLSVTQAETLSNIKKACDALVTHGGNVRLNPKSVSNYCQDPETMGGTVSPAYQTIRNMKIVVNGHPEKVFSDYIKRRERERKGSLPSPPPRKKPMGPGPASYLDLVETINDPDTRQWVGELIQTLAQAEGSIDYLQEQLSTKSKELGGLNMAEAISQGPDENANLPLMLPMMSQEEATNHLLTAIKAIRSLPDNRDFPFIYLNDRDALVLDTGSGPEMILSPKQWAAIVMAANGENDGN